MEMSDTIGIYANQIVPGQKILGCQKVIQNLLLGLEELNIKVEMNKPLSLCGCIQAVDELYKLKVPTHALIGPEIMVFPTDISWMWGYWKNWVQPSQWVVDNMKTYSITKKNMFYTWPIGINTDKFNANNKNIKYDCFIYYKNVNKTTPVSKLNNLRQELDKRKLKYIILEYGSYKEEQLISATKECKFGIMLTGTESQGIAYMEILSSDVPLFVFNENSLIFRGVNFPITTNISSCPYFDDRCGVKVNTFDFKFLDSFIDNLSSFHPREYILDNHTLKKGAEKYYNLLLETCNNPFSKEEIIIPNLTYKGSPSPKRLNRNINPPKTVVPDIPRYVNINRTIPPKRTVPPNRPR